MENAMAALDLNRESLKTVIRSALVALLAVMTFAASVNAANISDFTDFSIRPSRGQVTLAGRLYVPPSAPANPRPLILFMHGAGQSGFDNTANIDGNLDNLLAEARLRGAFLYAPQAPGSWANLDTLSLVMSMIDRAIVEYNADPRRIYVTGYSMGGGGTWNMLNHYGERFAAGVPICAVYPTTGFVPAGLLDEPIWAFHGLNDDLVDISVSREVVNSILDANGDAPPTYSPPGAKANLDFVSPTLDLRYTELYPGGHAIQSGVFRTPAMYDWLFSHASVPEPAGAPLAGLAVSGMLVLSRRRATR
jgi:predicted peptidase